LTLGTANAAGSLASAIRSDSTLLTFDATLPDAITFGQSGDVGTATVASRRDHAHGMASETAIPTASEAEMVAASSTSVYVTPGRQQYHPGNGKAWAKWKTVTSHDLQAQYNISSITDPGTGRTVLNFGTDFTSGDSYATTALCAVSGNNSCSPPASDSIEIYTFSDNGSTLVDSADNNIICMGTQ
tara:strand:- start:183 stop:740 length:558 start_codon:yes stop_codon:yes gene_type:complete